VDIVLNPTLADLRAALEAAAVRIGSMLDPQRLWKPMLQPRQLLIELQSLPMVETFSATRRLDCTSHATSAQKHASARNSQRVCKPSHAAADSFAGEDPGLYKLRSFYHRLLSDPKAAADDLERLWKNGTRQAEEPLQALGLALEN